MKRVTVVPGARVYQLNICEALQGHALCPGVTTLSAGSHKLGAVTCTCDCHKKPAVTH